MPQKINVLGFEGPKSITGKTFFPQRMKIFFFPTRLENEAKCKLLYLGQVNPQYQYKLGGDGIESSPSEKNLGVLVDRRLNMS